MNRTTDGRRLLAFIAGLALMARLAPLFRAGIGWAMWYDSPGFVELADGLRQGCGFARTINGRCAGPEIERTPGYPVLLAMFSDLRNAVAAQAVLGALTCLVLGLFALNRWGWLPALISSLLLAVDIPSVHASSQILSDSLFESLLTCAVIAELSGCARSGKSRFGLAFVSGVLYALAILVRPIGQVLILLVPLPFLVGSNEWRKRITLACLAAGLPMAVVIGWTLRNRIETGVTTFSSIAADDLLLYRAAGALQLEHGDSLRAEAQLLEAQLSARDSEDLELRIAEENQAATTIILHHPVAFAAMTLQDLFFLLAVPERRPLSASMRPGSDAGPVRIHGAIHTAFSSPRLAAARIFRDEFESSRVYVALALLQIVLTLATMSGVVLAVREAVITGNLAPVELWFPLSVAFLLLLAASGPEAAARLRLPAVPFLAMLAGVGWSYKLMRSQYKQSCCSRGESLRGGERIAL